MSNEIYIASTTTTDRFNIVSILLKSLKLNKKEETKINYYLFIKFTEQYNRQYCVDYFSRFIDDKFNIIIEDVDVFKDLVHTPARDHIYYAKCLFPKYFNDLEKLLFLDVDLVFVKEGIEDLWNTNINDYYVAATIDPTWQYSPLLKCDLINTGTDHYFNAGVILFNIKKLKEDKKDEELANWCYCWNLKKLKCICYDQTLVNYVLKDKVKLVDFKYNNSLLASGAISKDIYKTYLKQLGYENQFDSLNDAVILHFSGPNKPWDEDVVFHSTDYQYRDEAISVWYRIMQLYGDNV